MSRRKWPLDALARRLFPYRRCARTPLLDIRVHSSTSRRSLSFAPFNDSRLHPTVRKNTPLEEETLPNYTLDEFYPIHLGDELNSRYHVIGKLGYGSNSTVWFCRDTETSEYVAVKVYIRTPTGKTNREKAMYSSLANMTTTHMGATHIRPALDIFQIQRPNGDTHVCLVHPPLHSTLFAFQRLSGKPWPLPESIAKAIMKTLLEALDFLHTEANITHCDLKLSNLLLRSEDRTVFSHYEEMAPEKTINTSPTIYASRPFRPPAAHAYGLPVLCDFGEARTGGRHAYTEIQPDIYKAPEILMQTHWGHGVDLWNAGCLLWEMVSAEHLFSGLDEEGLHNNRWHICEMVGLLGLPPGEVLGRSRHSGRLFDEDGRWKADPLVVDMPLESRLKHFEGESRMQFLDFLGSMLCWLPEERGTAKTLLGHDWLRDV